METIMDKPYTPETLAARWQCSARSIRTLCRSGRLPAFRVGAKLWRIPAAAVEEYECRLIASADSADASSSSSTTADGESTATVLPPQTLAMLRARRRESSPR
jgi:excisionase family DNA binding protein